MLVADAAARRRRRRSCASNPRPWSTSPPRVVSTGPSATPATTCAGPRHSVGCFEAAAQAGCEAIVIASSGGAIYGEAEHLPASEDLVPAPMSAYGTEKLCEETYLWTYRRRGLRTIALRYGNVPDPVRTGPVRPVWWPSRPPG